MAARFGVNHRQTSLGVGLFGAQEEHQIFGWRHGCDKEREKMLRRMNKAASKRFVDMRVRWVDVLRTSGDGGYEKTCMA
jgi:hypothetical protein